MVPVPEPTPEAVRYYQSGIVLWLVASLWALAVPAALAWWGWGLRQRRLAERVLGRASRRWLLPAAVFVSFAVVEFLLDLPLDFYASYMRQHAYGLSNQTLAKWSGDALKGLGVSIALGAGAVWFVYWLLRRTPRSWWLWTGLAAFPVTAGLTLLAPVVIDPLFNDFGPMRDQALEARVLDLAEKAGIGDARVFEVQKSVDTEAVNAYVTGLLGTHRIVLWDTLLRKLEPEETLAVVGHEIGHSVLHHVQKGMAATAAFTLLGLFLVDRLARALLRRFRRRAGVEDLADPASLPLLLFTIALVGALLLPAGLAISRAMEREADRYGLALTGDGHAAAMSFVDLQRENLGYPRPARWVVLLRSSHPPLAERIETANAYRP
jgi:Zn-dependent protease with chaperone function